jgi:hypothetical protein
MRLVFLPRTTDVAADGSLGKRMLLCGN